MIYAFLANGFEECEAIAPIDILKRAGFEVVTVGVNGKTAVGAHNIPIICDVTLDEIGCQNIEAIILPGGMPGTTNLENSKPVMDIIDYCYDNNILIAAICAAPSIIGKNNFLKHKKATCFPGFEKYLNGAIITEDSVVCDGNFITAKGAGVAFQFGFAILEYLTDSATAENLKKTMIF